MYFTEQVFIKVDSLKIIPLLTLFFLAFAGVSTAATQPGIIFSQEIVAINADGIRLPSVQIEPEGMADLRTYDFDLGRTQLLRIVTNVQDAEGRGLVEVAGTVERCYRYIETATGREIERGILLYLIELDSVPIAYSFRASYDDPRQWGEVRLALIEQGVPLSGPDAPAHLTELLYDTLPHELGHDVLETLSHLSHDISGQSSRHTRWFIEGVCETLAKGFALQETPVLYRQFLASRHVDSVLSAPQMREDLLSWAQANQNGVVYESDLYGAAMLVVMTWTEFLPLRDLLARVQSSQKTLEGHDLLAMMQQTTGLDLQGLFLRAQANGRRLDEQRLLARLE